VNQSFVSSIDTDFDCASTQPILKSSGPKANQLNSIPTPSSNKLSHLLMQFAGTVSGVVACVLLDTGAGGTFISHAFARRAGIAVLPATGYSAATSANGTPVQILGMAVVHLKLQSLHCKIRCLVADLDAEHDVIIGEPWLREHRAVLSYDHLDVHVHKGNKTLLLRLWHY
jgi:hypothetical protein